MRSITGETRSPAPSSRARKASCVSSSGTARAKWCVWPAPSRAGGSRLASRLEIGDDRPRLPVADAPVPVCRGRVVEVRRHLHAAHPQQPAEEGVRALDVGTDRGDVVHPVAQRHLRRDRGHRLRPGLRIDARLIPVGDDHRGRRVAVLCAEPIRRLVSRPTRPSGGDLDDRAVGVGEVDRREVVAVERAADRDAEVGQPPLPS